MGKGKNNMTRTSELSSEDLSNQIFGDLTVIERYFGNDNKEDNIRDFKTYRYWKCLCSCGNSVVVRTSALTIDKKTICGYDHKYKIIMNKTFGKLKVIERLREIPSGVVFKTQCHCGKFINLIYPKIVNQTVYSCGCGNNNFNKSIIKNMDGNKILLSKLANIYMSYNDGNISFNEFIELIQLNCFYCNSPPSNKQIVMQRGKRMEKRKPLFYFLYSGLDRVDNSKRHTKDNVVPCCAFCNFSKKNNSFEYFHSWAKSISSIIINNDIQDIKNKINKLVKDILEG